MQLFSADAKAEFAEEGTFFANRFPSLRTLEFEKTNPTHF